MAKGSAARAVGGGEPRATLRESLAADDDPVESAWLAIVD